MPFNQVCGIQYTRVSGSHQGIVSQPVIIYFPINLVTITSIYSMDDKANMANHFLAGTTVHVEHNAKQSTA